MADQPWVMRTYSGHSSAKASNELYKLNLSKGQTGLSIAFDLPTQLGYDPDSIYAKGEVGKVGVPIVHLGDMETLFDEIPIEKMNTSMTINATAPWLFGLYLALAQNRGVDKKLLAGTTQNDIVKEYLSRGTYIFPPDASKRLTVDLITYAVKEVPKWNPINVCSYHLQEAGATPVQEVAYSLATAVGVLDAVKNSNRVSESEFPNVVGRISFFVNSGIRFIEEICKMRAFCSLWDEICSQRYLVQDPKLRRFRYGVQVNSLGLTELQPENNIQRITLEALGVTLSKNARARAIQLPAWNEALGLPRPWDQQWSLRIQQVLAYETDILEYDDIFDGSRVIEAKTDEIKTQAKEELQEILDNGGVFEMIDELKARLVRSEAERTRKIESGELKIVGVNCFVESEPSVLLEGLDKDAILRVDPNVEKERIQDVINWRKNRNQQAVEKAKIALKNAAKANENIMPSTIELALSGGTTGEWADVLRDVFGQYRAPTGIGGAKGILRAELSPARSKIEVITKIYRRPRILVAKPGLDGHSNGAEQIAVAARDAGFEVIYQGIRLTPEEIVSVAIEEDVDLIGLSILSGSHMEIVPEILQLLRERNFDVPIVVGGIIPDQDRKALLELGIKAIYTPKDYQLGRIMADLAEFIASAKGLKIA